MEVIEIIKDAIKNHPVADGLCSALEECGCGLDDLAPCELGPHRRCSLAKSRILGEFEYKDDCGPGDLWFGAI